MSPVIHAAACQEALARLPKLDRDELRQQWRALYQAEASPHLSRELLVRAVAYGMQELALGGLRAAPQRQLRQFAQQLKANAPGGREEIQIPLPIIQYMSFEHVEQ
jgi:hypothetical protein